MNSRNVEDKAWMDAPVPGMTDVVDINSLITYRHQTGVTDGNVIENLFSR